MITHKFRLYPSRKIEDKMIEYLDICRNGYNFFLGELNDQKEIDKSMIQGSIPDMKICDKRFSDVHSKSLQYEVYKLFSNLSGLSASKKKGRKVGSLRFKGKGAFKTFTYNQLGYKIISSGKKDSILHLAKIGDIPIRCHRQVKGIVKQVTVKRFASGKWYAFLMEERTNKKKLLDTDKIVGIDLGLIDTIYDSDGKSFANPRLLRKKEKRLRHLQRLMSNKKKGSMNRNRFRISLARQYEAVANSRDDFAHKVSRYYADNYSVIGFEDMSISDFTKGNQYAKSMSDAVWGKIRQFTTYKAESAGGCVVLVKTAGTTKECSGCGNQQKKELWERWYDCPVCGLSIPRDFNSALNIKRLCSKEIRLEQPDFKHLEIEALPHKATFVCEE